MSGFRSETTAQQETHWVEDDNWWKETSFPTLFSDSLLLGKKKHKKLHPVPFPNHILIWSNRGHMICSKIQDTELGSSVGDWQDLVAKV